MIRVVERQKRVAIMRLLPHNKVNAQSLLHEFTHLQASGRQYVWHFVPAY
jgi:hypothetical protein